VARFGEAATAVNTLVERVGDAVEVFESILPGQVGEGVRTYIAWDDLDEVVPGFYEQLAADRWIRVDATVGTDSRTADHERVGAVSVGITSCDVAIAATGTVVLAHGPGRPRSASLLVERHVVLLPVERIVHSLDEALARVEVVDTSNVVAITGPSRTGDIESILTLGVHGPRHLQVVLIG
jgi:L-lactate dehydrogenase complex protein LldG